MTHKIEVAALEEIIASAYDSLKDNTEGANADYIPYLAGVDSNLFGISVCLPSGRTINVGDADYVFGIESISKVHTAILALKQHGADDILKMIGANATGMPFNSIMAILLENDHPSTPLVNAGAIATTSIIQPLADAGGKWENIVYNMKQLAGSDLVLLPELYSSESDTNYNNHAISWLLKNYNRMYDDPDMSLDLYTRQCSMGVTCNQLAVSAATIALGGFNPTTSEQVFNSELSTNIVSLMATVGFYENSGDWLYECGVPAKSGVGGGIMGVVPGVMGVAAFSPRLDKAGNSVKAQKAIKFIANKIHANIFNGVKLVIKE